MSIVGKPIWPMGGGKGLPEFTYTGTYQVIDDGNDNWRIKFKSSGTLIFTKLNGAKKGIDVFLVGGGGNGANAKGCGSGGGGGGYTTTVGNVAVLRSAEYQITVGGSQQASTGFGATANAGSNGVWKGAGGNGGAGGGRGNAGNSSPGGKGGSNGGSSSGTGQGTSTREFWAIDKDATATLYAGGGGGGATFGKGGAGGDGGGGAGGGYSGGQAGKAGTANTGGGGGGAGAWSSDAGTKYGGAGGSGIVIIRNAR